MGSLLKPYTEMHGDGASGNRSTGREGRQQRIKRANVLAFYKVST
jgi:hypothetical protein